MSNHYILFGKINIENTLEASGMMPISGVVVPSSVIPTSTNAFYVEATMLILTNNYQKLCTQFEWALVV